MWVGKMSPFWFLFCFWEMMSSEKFQHLTLHMNEIIHVSFFLKQSLAMLSTRFYFLHMFLQQISNLDRRKKLTVSK